MATYASTIIMLSAGYASLSSTASSFLLQPIQPKRKCSHCETAILFKSQTGRIYNNRRVAILPPSESDYHWHGDAICHLSQISSLLELPIISFDHNDEENENDNSFQSSPTSYSHILTAVAYPSTNSYALAIHSNLPQKSSKRQHKTRLKLDPIFVDLCPPSNTRLGYRMNRKDGPGGEELLLKALSLKKVIADKQCNSNEPLVVYDLTAGLARDSLIILNAFVGNDAEIPPIRLHMVERDEIVALLVLDAMRRLQTLEQDGATKSELNIGYIQQLRRCLTMEQGDAIEVLERLSSQSNKEESVLFPPDICYLDPMFPPRKKKSSAVKKDMTMLHSLLGTAESHDNNLQSDNNRIREEQALLTTACKYSARRVVVKRPISAPPLGCSSIGESKRDIAMPSYDIRGSVNRWDVYVIS